MLDMFNFFNNRAQVPIESRNYSTIYLVLSGLLFLGTMWAVVDEMSTRRPWKDYQHEYFELSQQQWKERLNEAIAGIDSSALKQLQSDLNEANVKLQAQEYTSAEAEIRRIDDALLDANRDFTFAKSRLDEAYYFWKKSIHDGEEDLSWKKNVDQNEKQLKDFNTKVELLTARRDSLNRIIAINKKTVRDISSKISDLYAASENAQTKIERARSSSILIRQVMLNNFDRSNFDQPKVRIDRCQTCHLGWNDENMTDASQPFTKHPVPELLQIHNPEKFGCTTCHRGQGSALTAGYAHGNDDHHWEWPLLKGKETYGSCNTCHTNELHIRFGDRINKAKRMLVEAGCYGCHEIAGYTDLPKIGPELNQLTAKTKPEWLFRWIRNPKDYNPHTRMPNFKFKDDDAEAITAYLWNIGEQISYRPQKGIASGGVAARGKEIVETIGCMGCHVIGSDTRVREARGFSYDMAPELTRTSSKLDPDWIFEWIKNPRRYRPTTQMPSLRLSDQEARDVVAHLMTLKESRQFEQKALRLDSPEIIKRGEKLIREYGCHGCHVIKGMEKEGRVSVALSNFGRKRVDELDYGDTKVPHTWDDWVYNKIKDARVFTTDRIISKMPVFSLADSEIVNLRTLLRNFTKEQPEIPYQRAYDKRLQAIEAGRKLTEYYNCVNCHQIEEVGGSIKAILDDEGLAPPYLYPEGAKVQEPWLHNFLKEPSTIRPWLKIRMPTFNLTDDEINSISKYFLALHRQELELRDYTTTTTETKYLSAGKKLFDDFQCMSCHYTGIIPEGKTPADLAPNLTFAKGRLKPKWILDWLARPDSIQPGTRMPSYFPDMQSPDTEILGGDAKEQIRAIRDYVLTLRK